MRKMKDLLLVVFTAMFVTTSYAQKDDVTLYFTVDEMPDLIKCLPAPPDTCSPEFANDILRYMWGKQQRLDSARAAIAIRDAVWSFDALFAEFNIPFGLEISKTGTPEIYKLLINGISTIDQTRRRPKAYYMRKRPFVRFNEHMLSTWEEKDLYNEGSYPSGHTQRGFACALLLSEINPANADTILKRGYIYGESRVIVGAHWQSDVDASRISAPIGLARLHTSPEFLKQLAKAQEEFARLTGKSTAGKTQKKSKAKK